MAQALPHAIMYTAGQQQVHYLPQYYSTPYAQYAPSSYPDRTLKTERRRPKYTRSKTGCLTCRKKKVKCDETRPACQRCSNSQLSCTWPEIPPPKKKTPSRKARSPADQGYSTATTSEADTSSLSPTDAGDLIGTPQPSFKSEAPSPEIEQESAPALAFPDPNMLHVGAGASSDRRHSEPHFVPLASSAIETRRHSMADIMDGQQQQYVHHTGHHHHHPQPQQHQNGYNHGMNTGNGALGLSLNQLAHTGAPGSSTRPSTPNDFLYPHAHAHTVQHAPPPSSAFTGYSPSGNVTIIPNISSGSTSSRPSTAASSLSLSRSLHRTSASSRPSTAGSHVGASAGGSIAGHQHQYMHRPASSGGGSGAGDYSSLGFSPFSFQLGRNPGEVSLDAANAMGGYASACVSRPSTANSIPSASASASVSASASPYMRHGAMPMDNSGGMGVERWHVSPLLGQSSPLAQPQPHAVNGSVVGAYFQQMMHSPPQHSRTQSPAWAC